MSNWGNFTKFYKKNVLWYEDTLYCREKKTKFYKLKAWFYLGIMQFSFRNHPKFTNNITNPFHELNPTGYHRQVLGLTNHIYQFAKPIWGQWLLKKKRTLIVWTLGMRIHRSCSFFSWGISPLYSSISTAWGEDKWKLPTIFHLRSTRNRHPLTFATKLASPQQEDIAI